MKKWLFAILFGSVLALGACGGGDDSAEDTGDDTGDNVEVSAAEDIYKSNCSSCHGGDLSGGAGPALDNVGADYSADEIKDIIDNGKGDMPPQNLEEDDRDTVAEWLAEKK